MKIKFLFQVYVTLTTLTNTLTNIKGKHDVFNIYCLKMINLFQKKISTYHAILILIFVVMKLMNLCRDIVENHHHYHLDHLEIILLVCFFFFQFHISFHFVLKLNLNRRRTLYIMQFKIIKKRN